MILKMPHQQVGEVNLVDEMVDRLLDILADKLTERLSAGHKELYTAKELAERYGVSCRRVNQTCLPLQSFCMERLLSLIHISEPTRP